MHKKLAFEDALPDLIIGLVGIPVGFSLQKVMSVTLQTALCSKQQWEGLAYFASIILLYGLFSVALYMPVELGQRLARQLAVRERKRRTRWQKYLVLRVLLSLPLSVLVVATLAAVGLSFEQAMQPQQQYVQFIGLSFPPIHLIYFGFAEVTLAYMIAFAGVPFNRLLDEYPVVAPCCMAATLAGFVGSALVFFTFMD